jgi:2,4-dienoyl-CoA reductase-like NADH-dependent reductase (Old Yellow Enzyme family)
VTILDLFAPIKVGRLQLKHRVVMAPLTRMRADPETFAARTINVEYYSQRASLGGSLSRKRPRSRQAGAAIRLPRASTPTTKSKDGAKSPTQFMPREDLSSFSSGT